jgi:predicted ATPase
VQRGLQQLEAAEFLYQRGLLPQATYIFKHVLIQEAAYQSLLKSTRQQYHQHIAWVLEARFPEICETQPELLAYHYTEASLNEQAIGYWQRAGERALQRSANPEAIQHLTRGLHLLAALPENPARDQQELDLQLVLVQALAAIRGTSAPEVEQTYARARALCAQIGETPQLSPTLLGLWRFYRGRGALSKARELGEQLFGLAQRGVEPIPRLEAHDALGTTLFFLGDYTAAQTHVEQGFTLADLTTQWAQVLRNGEASGIRCLGVSANALWCLGYPSQAMQRGQEALVLAQELAHPYSLAVAQGWVAHLHYRRREVSAVQTQANDLLTLATTQGFSLFAGFGTCWRGWILTIQGEGTVGLAQLHQGLAAIRATGAEQWWLLFQVVLVEAAGHAGLVEEGLCLLAEALTMLEASGHGDLLAEAYRLQGSLLLRQSVTATVQAEACFQQALTIARRQKARSWELRAATSLARLWQQQGKRAEAHELLAPIYSWFTEGFDTADLQDAQTLLSALATEP